VVRLDDKIENISNEIMMKDKSELGEVMDNLDNDTVDTLTAMSSIDFNTRLNRSEINASLVFDELIRLKILPQTIGLTRQKKRLSVSLDGLGREEKVRIIAGKREDESGSSFGNKLSNLFRRKE